jgi:hypothetical protein
MLIEPIAPNWTPCLRCRRLELSIRSCYKYIQQHIAGYTENNWAPHLIRVALGIDIFFQLSPLGIIILLFHLKVWVFNFSLH